MPTFGDIVNGAAASTAGTETKLGTFTAPSGGSIHIYAVTVGYAPDTGTAVTISTNETRELRFDSSAGSWPGPPQKYVVGGFMVQAPAAAVGELFVQHYLVIPVDWNVSGSGAIDVYETPRGDAMAAGDIVVGFEFTR